uniref:Plus3 domain-containing protein n=2 Tax=Compsopogon caeruleus TaxID=31354 RepID=A0A7S1TFA0_9RHOD
MDEIEREAILATRFEQRQRRREQFELRKKVRMEKRVKRGAAASDEKKPSTGVARSRAEKKAAMDAMARSREIRASAKTREPRTQGSEDEREDSDDEGYGSDSDYDPGKSAPREPKSPTHATPAPPSKPLTNDNDPMEYSDLVREILNKERREGGDDGPRDEANGGASDEVKTTRVTSPVFVRRDTLLDWVSRPWFDKAVKGLFVRVSMGVNKKAVPPQPYYKLCTVEAAVSSNQYVRISLQPLAIALCFFLFSSAIDMLDRNLEIFLSIANSEL